MTHSILFVDHADALGGAERSLLMLMQHLDPMLWQVHLVTSAGELADKAKASGIPVYERDFPRLRGSISAVNNLVKAGRSIAKLANEIGASLIYANTIRATFITAVAAKFAKKPWVWHMRDFWLGENQPHYPQTDRWLKRALCFQATHIITNSHAVAQHLPASEHLAVVHNGIDLSRYQNRDANAFRKRFELDSTRPLIGTVGRLRPWKGQLDFIEMARHVHEQLPDAQFAIVGGSTFGVQDGYEAQLRQAVQNAGLENDVTMTGAIDDVQNAMAAFDIFVHCGAPEPFGLVNIEAMAAQTPVVAYAHGALPEIVIQGKTGILVAPNDTNALADAVLNVLDDKARSQKMAQLAEQTVHEKFDVKITAANVSRVLKQVLDRL